jgi:hypothetical protein
VRKEGPPEEKAKGVRAFLLSLIDEEKLQELTELIENDQLEELSRQEEAVVKLLVQLLDYEAEHGIAQ